MKQLAIGLFALLSLAAPALAQDAAAGEKVFRRCASCHAVGEGAQNKLGPQLNGLLGRTAGGLDDYAYSPAMRDAGAGGLVWTPETLAEYLLSPGAFVPGTRMKFPGLKRPAEIADTIAYLQALSPDFVPPAP